MKFNLLFVIGLVIFFTSCGEDDPCDQDVNSVECPTGDFDGDGIANSEDTDPSDACVPNLPSFEENIVGTWAYDIGIPGMIRINEDGTYEDLQNEIVSNGDIMFRMWRIENEAMIFDVGNASLELQWKEFDCANITFDGQGFIPDIVFSRQ